MRKLTRRESHLIVVFTALAVIAGASLYFAPKEPPNPEAVKAFYINLFGRAHTIVIGSATGEMEPVTVTRDKDPGLFNRLHTAARFSGVSPTPSPYPPRWILDVSADDGSEITDVTVSFHLEAPKQPARGALWLIPRLPGQDEPEPVMVEIIDDYMESLRAEAAEDTSE